MMHSREVGIQKKLMTPYRIVDLKSQRLRNLVRGLNAQDADRATLVTFRNIRKEAQPQDGAALASILLNGNAYRSLPLPSEFPERPVRGEDIYDVGYLDLNCELHFQCERIRKNSKKLTKAIAAIDDINRVFSYRNYRLALEYIEKFLIEFGYSITILNKICYIYSQPLVDQVCKDKCKSILDLYGLSERIAIPLATADIMGSGYDFLPIRKNITEYANSVNSSFIKGILKWQLKPIVASSSEQIQRLHSLSIYSLIDAAVFIFSYALNSDIWIGTNRRVLVESYLNSELLSAWRKMAGRRPVGANVDKEEENYIDLRFLRQSNAFIELSQTLRFRLIFDQIYVLPDDKPIKLSETERKSIDDFFNGVRIEDLLKFQQKPGLPKERFNPADSGFLTRTVGLIYLIRCGLNLNSLTDDQLLRIMSLTQGVSTLLSDHELRSLASDPEQTKIKKYVSSALLSDSSKQLSDQHKYRRILQAIVQSDYHSDIVEFAEWLNTGAPNVADHLFQTCTEDFLIQLYHIFANPSEAYETRARLLDWHAELRNEPSSRERAKAIRLDMRLRRIRGEIDDMRVYIDSTRFSSWLQDNLLDDIGAVFRGEPLDREAIDSFREFGDYTVQRLPHVILARIAQIAFIEFCSNKKYGIDSYLGRRIRHGTLKGYMTSGIKSILAKSEYVYLLKRPELVQWINKWLSEFSESVDEWANDYFQIRSKSKPRGAISFDVLSSSKLDTLKNFMIDVMTSYEKTPNYQIVVNLLIEYCWHMIAPDLTAIRTSIASSRPRWGILDKDRLPMGLDADCAAQAVELCREINSHTDDRFRSVSRWFGKPTVVAPSALLSELIQVVIEEVHELVPEFGRDSVDIVCEGDIHLIGGIYHHFYDCLFIIVHNAARHGKQDGLIAIRANAAQVSDRELKLSIFLSNDVKIDADPAEVFATIRSYQAMDADDAMTVEGNSGIRKLTRLVADAKEIESVEFSLKDRIIAAEMTVLLQQANV